LSCNSIGFTSFNFYSTPTKKQNGKSKRRRPKGYKMQELKCEKCGMIGIKKISDFWELIEEDISKVYCYPCSLKIEKEYQGENDESKNRI